MSSACRSALLASPSALHSPRPQRRAELRVCADPDNLPLSRTNGERGFENRIARLVADDMGAMLRYEWMPLRRGFVRKTMGAGSCDVFIGVPEGFRSRPDDARVLSLELRLRRRPGARGIDTLRRSAPGQAAHRRAADRQRPRRHARRSRAGGARERRQRARLSRSSATAPRRSAWSSAVADGSLDVALIWGPQAGYFAARATSPLEVACRARSRIRARALLSSSTSRWACARGEPRCATRLDAILERRRADIDAILAEYSVPRTDLPAAARP